MQKQTCLLLKLFRQITYHCIFCIAVAEAHIITVKITPIKRKKEMKVHEIKIKQKITNLLFAVGLLVPGSGFCSLVDCNSSELKLCCNCSICDELVDTSPEICTILCKDTVV